MSWEYLQTPAFQARLLNIAAVLEKRVRGKHIYDLNCGTAPLAPMLSGFASYSGNDVCPEFIEEARARRQPNANFEIAPDCAVNPDRVNVLLWLGAACSQFMNEKAESPTSLSAFCRLVRQHRPELVVVEMVRRWQNEFGLMDYLIRVLGQHGYALKQAAEQEIAEVAGFVGQRQYAIFESEAVEQHPTEWWQAARAGVGNWLYFRRVGLPVKWWHWFLARPSPIVIHLNPARFGNKPTSMQLWRWRLWHIVGSNRVRRFFGRLPDTRLIASDEATAEIHKEYQRIAAALVSGDERVLKTDCWNEAETDYPIATILRNCVCVEIDPARVQLARSKHSNCDVRIGSITHLTFPDGTFDKVLDFSTIDHVLDYETVLDEYRRILRPGGKAVVVVWLNSHETFATDTRWGGAQFYFSRSDFERSLKRRFQVEERHVLGGKGDQSLVQFVCAARV